MRKIRLSPPMSVLLILALSLVPLAMQRHLTDKKHVEIFGELPNPGTCFQIEKVDVVFLNMNRTRKLNAEEREASFYLLKNFELKTGVLRDKIITMDLPYDACKRIVELEAESALYIVSLDNDLSTNLSDLKQDKERCLKTGRNGMRFDVPLFVRGKFSEIYLHKILSLNRNELFNLKEINEISYHPSSSPRCFVSPLNEKYKPNLTSHFPPIAVD